MNMRHTSLPRGAIRSVVHLCLMICALAAGCQSGGSKSQSPPLSPPQAQATVRHHAGAPLALPTTRAIDPTAAGDALAVEVRWAALDRIPANLPTIAPSARLIAVPASTRPIAPSGQLISQARLVKPQEIDSFLADVQAGKFGRSAEIATSRGALPADVTAVFALAESSAEASDRHGLEVAVYRSPNASGGDAMQVGLAISDSPRRERALLDPVPLGTGMKLALVIPAKWNGNDSHATLAVIEASRQTGPEQTAALAQCVKDLSSMSEAAKMPQLQPSADSAALAAALQTLATQPDSARPALIFLTARTDANLCSEVALVADDQTLSNLTQRILSKAAPASGAMDKPKLAWLLDSACFEELAAMQSAEKVPPELAAVLSAYAGEAGRHAASLEEIARGLSSREQLEARVLAENLVYLEDASPAARVRAYDWLATKNLAPAGYDPLGSNKDRRAALDKAVPASATQAPGGAK